jgi:hypothetical protein
MALARVTYQGGNIVYRRSAPRGDSGSATGESAKTLDLLQVVFGGLGVTVAIVGAVVAYYAGFNNTWFDSIEYRSFEYCGPDLVVSGVGSLLD